MKLARETGLVRHFGLQRFCHLCHCPEPSRVKASEELKMHTVDYFVLFLRIKKNLPAKAERAKSEKIRRDLMTFSEITKEFAHWKIQINAHRLINYANSNVNAK